MPTANETVAAALRARRAAPTAQRAQLADTLKNTAPTDISHSVDVLQRAKQAFIANGAPTDDWDAISPSERDVGGQQTGASLARRTLAKHAARTMDDDGILPDSDAAISAYDNAARELLDLAICAGIAALRDSKA